MIESYAYEIFRQDARETVLNEGLERGTVLKGRKDVLHVLQIRFQDVPLPIREFIEHVDQEAMLDVLLEKAITAASLQEFDNVIQQMRS